MAERVAKGGHDIPEANIRERWANSIYNLMLLIPHCAALTVFNNSTELQNGRPSPLKLFALQHNAFTAKPIAAMPDWAKPLAAVAMRRVLCQ